MTSVPVPIPSAAPSPAGDASLDACSQAALSAFRHLARTQPELMLSLFLAETKRFENPSRALDALEDCGADLGAALSLRPGDRARSSCSELGSLCAQHDPSSLDRLSRSMPGFWLLARHGDVFRSLADALDSSWDAPADSSLDAARMATDWIGAGLSPPAWRELSNRGGPAWRAFRDVHAKAAQADPFRSIAPSDMGDLSWKGAARVARASGMTGYGLHNDWPGRLASAQPSITDRLCAALGLRELVSEMRAASESRIPGAANAFSMGRERLGSVFSLALDHDAPQSPWSGFIHRALQSLPQLGLSPAALACPIPNGYALPKAFRESLPSVNMRSKPSGSACLPDLLAMSRSGTSRALGLDLGADALNSFALWKAATLAELARQPGLPPRRTERSHGPSAEALAIIDAQELAMDADASRWAAGQRCPPPKARASRI